MPSFLTLYYTSLNTKVICDYYITLERMDVKENDLTQYPW